MFLSALSLFGGTGQAGSGLESSSINALLLLPKVSLWAPYLPAKQGALVGSFF